MWYYSIDCLIVQDIELLPAWLRFLESRQLIDAQQRASAINDLRILVGQASPIWQRISDPTLTSDIERAWATQETDRLHERCTMRERQL